MSDKEESAPIAAASAAPDAGVDTAKIDTAPATPAEEPKAAVPVVDEKPSAAAKSVEPQPAKEEAAKPDEGKHFLSFFQPLHRPHPFLQSLHLSTQLAY